MSWRGVFVALLAWGLWCGAGDALAREGELRLHRDDDRLLADWDLRPVLDDATDEALRSGLPSRMRVRVELWRKRSGFWDHLVTERALEYRVVYDLLDDRFEVIDEFGDRLLSTRDDREVEEVVGAEFDFPVCELEKLDADRRYYLVLELRLEPLSVEEMQDLERWLRGSLGGRSGESGGVGAFSKQLFGVLKGRVGLGEKSRTERSEEFRPRELPADAGAKRP